MHIRHRRSFVNAPFTSASRRRLKAKQGGTALIEFALAAPVYFFLVLSTMEFLFFALVNGLLGVGLDRAVHEALIGGTNTNEVRTEVCKLVPWVSSNCGVLDVSIRATGQKGFDDSARTLVGCQGNDPKAGSVQGQLVSINVCYDMPSFGAMTALMKSASAGQPVVVQRTRFFYRPDYTGGTGSGNSANNQNPGGVP